MAERNSPVALSRVLEILRAHRPELQSIGVQHAVIFGSVARDQTTAGSDIDIAVAVDPTLVRALFDYGDIQQRLEEWLNRAVDLACLDRLRPGVAADVAEQGVHAF